MVVFENKTEIICIVHKKYNHGLLGVLKKEEQNLINILNYLVPFRVKFKPNKYKSGI